MDVAHFTEAREQELSQWEGDLIQREASFATAIGQFRGEIAEKVGELTFLQEQLAKRIAATDARERRLMSREALVSRKERALLDRMAWLSDKLRQVPTGSTAATSPAAVSAQASSATKPRIELAPPSPPGSVPASPSGSPRPPLLTTAAQLESVLLGAAETEYIRDRDNARRSALRSVPPDIASDTSEEWEDDDDGGAEALEPHVVAAADGGDGLDDDGPAEKEEDPGASPAGEPQTTTKESASPPAATHDDDDDDDQDSDADGQGHARSTSDAMSQSEEADDVVSKPAEVEVPSDTLGAPSPPTLPDPPSSSVAGEAVVSPAPKYSSFDDEDEDDAF